MASSIAELVEMEGGQSGVGIISWTERPNWTTASRSGFLQEYDNLRNGTVERIVIGQNGT